MRPSSQRALAAMRFSEQPPGSAFYLTPVEHLARINSPVSRLGRAPAKARAGRGYFLTRRLSGWAKLSLQRKVLTGNTFSTNRGFLFRGKKPCVSSCVVERQDFDVLGFRLMTRSFRAYALAGGQGRETGTTDGMTANEDIGQLRCKECRPVRVTASPRRQSSSWRPQSHPRHYDAPCRVFRSKDILGHPGTS